MKKLFVTATDTDAGKTYVAQLLTYKLVLAKQQVAVFKPISAGCQWQNKQLVNEDAQLLQAQANCQQQLDEINPIAFEPAIAPHIAAQQLSQQIHLDDLASYYQKVLQNPADIVITEGAGGWRLPLGEQQYLSEFVQQSQQDVILVVNMKLGCLNHAMLTYQAIINDGLNCLAWVANCYQEMPYLNENIAELSSVFPMPLLGTLPYETDLTRAAKHLNIEPLLS